MLERLSWVLRGEAAGDSNEALIERLILTYVLQETTEALFIAKVGYVFRRT
jgi:hypothetical protein